MAFAAKSKRCDVTERRQPIGMDRAYRERAESKHRTLAALLLRSSVYVARCTPTPSARY